MEQIGLLGAILLAICGLPEAISAVLTGESRVGYGFLGLWLSGELLLLIYNLFGVNDHILNLNYIMNIILITIILYYKISPREKSNMEGK